MRAIAFLIKFLFKALKWIVLAAVFVEVGSFVLVSLTNYMVYGTMYEGTKYVYDPYVLFHSDHYPRGTWNVPPDEQVDGPRLDLWLFGGSTMRGSTISDTKTIPSFLAQYLHQDVGGANFFLTNYGIDSFNSLLETKLLQKELIEGEPPQVIIFYDGANDCAYFSQYRSPDAHFGYRKVKALIESGRDSILGRLKPLNAYIQASYAKELWDKIRQVFFSVDMDTAALAEFVDAEELRYDYLARTAEQNGARFLLFWQPILWVETGEVAPEVRTEEEAHLFQSASFDTMRENFRIVNDALYERLKDKEYFVDFRNVLTARTGPVYNPDGVHLTDAGRDMVARNMSRVLAERLGDLWGEAPANATQAPDGSDDEHQGNAQREPAFGNPLDPLWMGSS